MKSLVLSLGAASLLATAAHAWEPQVTADQLVWSSREVRDGRVFLTGTNAATGERFALKVLRNGSVSGKIGGRRVSYWVSPDRYAGLIAGQASGASGRSAGTPGN